VERVVPAEGGDPNAGVAVAGLGQPARIEQVSEVAVLARAAEPGDRAREAYDRDDLPPRAHARIARRARRVADHLELEAEARPFVQHPKERSDEDRNEEPERQPDPVERPERPG